MIGEFCDRSLDAGNPKKVAAVACRRKLLTILNAVLRDQTLWNATRHVGLALKMAADPPAKIPSTSGYNPRHPRRFSIKSQPLLRSLAHAFSRSYLWPPPFVMRSLGERIGGEKSWSTACCTANPLVERTACGNRFPSTLGSTSMFSAIRRAWRGYLASIPKPDEPELVSERVIRESLRTSLPKSAPHSDELRQAFSELANILVAHLPADVASDKARRLNAKFKPDTSPSEALSNWIHSNGGPKSTVGVIQLDWKAREEVQWQAEHLAKAHGVNLSWRYDHHADQEWLQWQERDESPVDTPLKGLTQALSALGLVLFRFSVDDRVLAFAVDRSRQVAVEAACAVLGIPVTNDISRDFGAAVRRSNNRQ